VKDVLWKEIGKGRRAAKKYVESAMRAAPEMQLLIQARLGADDAEPPAHLQAGVDHRLRHRVVEPDRLAGWLHSRRTPPACGSRWRRPLFLVLAMLFAAGFAVLDAREVVHQVAVVQPLGASLAVAVTALHVTTAAAVLLLIRAAIQNTRVAA
jgi:hypothetical protein